jgi:glycosyltransferase involved in cell wall biosynthesis
MGLRVLQISQNYHVRGGSDVMFLQNIALLEKHGHRVIPFTARSDKNLPGPYNHYFPAGANFEHPGPMDLIRFIYSRPARKAIEIIIRRFKPQIAHLHIYYGKLTPSILSPLKMARIPVVQTIHEYKLICPVYRMISNGKICEECRGKHFWRALPRRCNRGSFLRTLLNVTETYFSHWLGAVDKINTFIAVSDALREKYINCGLPREKFVTIRNWVDASKVRPADQQGQYFLYFGRIEQLKGIFTLMDAMAGLPHIRLLLVGDGEARQAVIDQIRQQGWKHIECLGFKQGPELQYLIHNSICTIIPSEWHEPFPTTVMESFANARPVIVAEIGGIPELIVDGKDGFLFPPGDARALREKILWLYEHPRQAVQMGQAGREKVETNFNATRYLNELLVVYKKALATNDRTT